MTSISTMFMIIVLCWTMMDQFTFAEFSKDVWDFYSIFNGHYNNFDEDNEQRGKQDQVDIFYKPLNIPQLQKDPAIYLEESLNGRVYRMFVFTVTELPINHTVMATYYNFTDPKKHKPRSFNTDSLANYTREFFDSSRNCEAILEQVAPGIFTGDLMDCRRLINGQHPTYSCTVTCDSFRLEPPVVSEETTTLLRYYLKHKGLRYQLKGVPKGYINPCKKSK